MKAFGWKKILLATLTCALVIKTLGAQTETDTQKVCAVKGKLYHGVFPGGKTGAEDDITPADVDIYEKTVGQKVAWVYFSNNWYKSREFPRETAEWIRARGAVPFVRLMLRSDPEENHAEKLYNLKAILAGKFDTDFKNWALQAKQFGTPVLVEWGTECNGQWFSWSAKWNNDPSQHNGPQRFAAAFRHIVQLTRVQGATNLTWVFHPDAHDDPAEEWNRFENYYPGNDVVDWIGFSAYGPQKPMDTEAQSFREMADPCYQRLVKMAPAKPIFVLEFGCTAGSKAVTPDHWAEEALADLLGGRWPNIAGFSWWNEGWKNDKAPAHDTNMRVQGTPALGRVFKRKLEAFKNKVQQSPVYRK
jgi:hypothetical protein